MIGARTNMINIKSDDEIRIMREAGRHVAQVMQILVDALKPGIRTKDLDKIVRQEYAKRGVVPTFLGYAYPPYPATVCVSVNDELVHGIPGNRIIQPGDLVSIDLGATYKGFVGDHAVTVCVPPVTEEKQKLIDVTRGALMAGIEAARAGVRLGVVSHTIQQYIESRGYGVVREYVGHGVGRAMHEEPQVPNFGSPERGPTLRRGMVLALEPMVTVGDWRTKKHADQWTVSTLDGSLCAHFEHTIAITDDGAEILTLP
ncbi:MAG TPA: type I methionyl aminopeptidase [Dehalococcoidia bacterium]|nr:type I methionyl aminopeptidase [Dehalococcoidia bacterium]